MYDRIKKYQETPMENNDLKQSRNESGLSFNELIADIVHEINNPVNIVRNYVTIMQRNMKEVFMLLDLFRELKENIDNDEKKRKLLRKIEERMDIEETKQELSDAVKSIDLAFKRIQDISYNLTKESKQKELTPIMFDVNQCIEETLFMVGREIDDHIEIQKHLSPLCEIKSYQGKLNQLLMNLIKNSIEAIWEKKELLNEFLYVKTSLDQENVIIIIIDSGIGMAGETKRNLYNRHYTTKSYRKGIGLGMGICQSIVEKHQGTIEINSIMNRGTMVQIMLPVTH